MSTQSKSDFWQEHISAWKDSDLSQATYCQKHELKLSTFTYWCNKQNKSRRKLIPVSMSVPDGQVELALPGGIHMRLPVSALGRRCYQKIGLGPRAGKTDRLPYNGRAPAGALGICTA